MDGNRDLCLDRGLGDRAVFVLLPAYNEEEGLEKLLVGSDRILRAFAIRGRIVIVNDGSADRTHAPGTETSRASVLRDVSGVVSGVSRRLPQAVYQRIGDAQ